LTILLYRFWGADKKGLRLKVNSEKAKGKGGKVNMSCFKATLIITALFLFLGISSGQALISPEHYERMLKERQKGKEGEKKEGQGPDKGYRPGSKKGHPTGSGQGGNH
jgi:hypothetical protein